MVGLGAALLGCVANGYSLCGCIFLRSFVGLAVLYFGVWRSLRLCVLRLTVGLFDGVLRSCLRIGVVVVDLFGVLCFCWVLLVWILLLLGLCCNDLLAFAVCC